MENDMDKPSDPEPESKSESKAADESARATPESITIHAAGRPDGKRLGEATEAAFLAKACTLDFAVSKPWGDSRGYDFVVEFGGTFWRVQVKTARRQRSRRCEYNVEGGGGTTLYTEEEIDFLVAYVVPDDLWYVIPIEAFVGRTTLHFSPRCRRKAKYERYREVWCLLACTRKVRGWKDIPVLCRCRELPVRCAVCPRQ
jgi:PD-(D/E)XK endonuclease